MMRRVSDKYIEKIIDIVDKHMKNYGKRKMSLEALDKLFKSGLRLSG